jgi:hypothetical protein
MVSFRNIRVNTLHKGDDDDDDGGGGDDKAKYGTQSTNPPSLHIMNILIFICR